MHCEGVKQSVVQELVHAHRTVDLGRDEPTGNENKMKCPPSMDLHALLSVSRL